MLTFIGHRAPYVPLINFNIMKTIKLTSEQVRNNHIRNYNPTEWDKVIDRIENFQDVEYFMAPKDQVFQYDRFYAEYTLPTGLRLFRSIGYDAMITDGGYYRLDKHRVTSDGKSLIDAMNMMKEGKEQESRDLIALLTDEEASEQWYDISYGKFTDEESGKEVLIGTNDKAREWMIERSVKYGLTFTKGNL